MEERGKGRHPLAGPAWDGMSPRGKTLLVHTEQGLGDGLQFGAYPPLLAEQGAQPVIQCSAPLENLLATVPGVVAAFEPGEPLPHYDAHIPLLSLPRIFGTEAASIPAKVPYLTASAGRRAAVKASFSPGVCALRVG